MFIRFIIMLRLRNGLEKQQLTSFVSNKSGLFVSTLVMRTYGPTLDRTSVWDVELRIIVQIGLFVSNSLIVMLRLENGSNHYKCSHHDDADKHI